MAKEITTKKTIRDVPEKENNLSAAIRNYIKDDVPLPDDFPKDIEYEIRVNRITDDGRKVKVAGKKFVNLESCIDDIGNTLGRGRYKIWISWNVVGETKRNLVTVDDVEIDSDFDPEATDYPPQLPVHTPREDEGGNDEELSFRDMFLAQQQTMTAMLMKLIDSRAGVSSEPRSEGSMEAMMNMFMKGIELGQNGVASEPEGLTKYLPVLLDILKGGGAQELLGAIIPKKQVAPLQSPPESPTQVPPQQQGLTWNMIEGELEKPENAELKEKFTGLVKGLIVKNTVPQNGEHKEK